LVLEEAAYLGAPKSAAVYFTVDFDAQTGDMSAIIEYFRGVREGLAGQYPVGAYGSYSVLQALQTSASAPDKYFQTYAWSKGLVFSGNNVYQYQNDVTLQGIDVDHDTIQYNSGCWPEIEGKMNYLVLYYGDADLQIAADLAQNFQCPIVQIQIQSPITKINPDPVPLLIPEPQSVTPSTDASLNTPVADKT